MKLKTRLINLLISGAVLALPGFADPFDAAFCAGDALTQGDFITRYDTGGGQMAAFPDFKMKIGWRRCANPERCTEWEIADGFNLTYPMRETLEIKGGTSMLAVGGGEYSLQLDTKPFDRPAGKKLVKEHLSVRCVDIGTKPLRCSVFAQRSDGEPFVFTGQTDKKISFSGNLGTNCLRLEGNVSFKPDRLDGPTKEMRIVFYTP